MLHPTQDIQFVWIMPLVNPLWGVLTERVSPRCEPTSQHNGAVFSYPRNLRADARAVNVATAGASQ